MIQENKTLFSPHDEIEILDIIYRNHIEPVLTVLEETLEELVKPVFQDFQSQMRISVNRKTTRFSPPLTPGKWEQLKQDIFCKPGFELSNSQLLEISCQYAFNHVDKISSVANLDVEITWFLDADKYVRKAAVSGNEIPKLEHRILYAELNRKSSGLDRLISGIMEIFMTYIDVP
ncbi:MAG: hypothetical protein F4X92_07795 [Gammaproteobacteria bacterium]|nr:hypothetical protein [Gammaproteobacteria bacterium]